MDITGFNEQIGLTLPRLALPQIKAMVPAVKKTMIQNKAPLSILAKAKASAAAFKPKPITTPFKPSFLDKAKLTTALNKAKQTGQSVIVKTPNGAKKFTPKGAAFNLVPTASKLQPSVLRPVTMQPSVIPVEAVKNEVKQFEQTMQTLPAAKQAEAIFNLPPTPAIVKNLTPIQQSFLKTDLPYQVISKNNYGQPKTKFLKNTPLKFNIDIDQIQPPVDSGISNYYGK